MKQAPLLDVDPSARRDDDFYATPAWMTRALLARVPLWRADWSGRLVEPCAGDGAIVRLLPPDADVLTNDLVARPPILPEFLLDARRRETWDAFARTGHLTTVVTNPPFDVAFDIVRHAVDVAGGVVAMLLRLSWLEPTEERGPWLAAHPPRLVIVMPRHDFRGNGQTDSVTSAWFVWTRLDNICDRGVDVVTRDERDRLLAIDRRGGAQ